MLERLARITRNNNMLCKKCKKKIKGDYYRKIGLGAVHEECLDGYITQVCAKNREKKQKQIEEMKTRKKQETLKGTLWKYFKMFIYLRDSDKEGMCVCISCGRIVHYSSKNLHAGHFIPKSAGNYFYFNEDNVHAQCGKCNYYGSQDTGANYRENLIKKIGLEKVEDLEQKKRVVPTTQFSKEWLENKIKHYKNLIKDLKIKK